MADLSAATYNNLARLSAPYLLISALSRRRPFLLSPTENRVVIGSWVCFALGTRGLVSHPARFLLPLVHLLLLRVHLILLGLLGLHVDLLDMHTYLLVLHVYLLALHFHLPDLHFHPPALLVHPFVLHFSLH